MHGPYNDPRKYGDLKKKIGRVCRDILYMITTIDFLLFFYSELLHFIKRIVTVSQILNGGDPKLDYLITYEEDPVPW